MTPEQLTQLVHDWFAASCGDESCLGECGSTEGYCVEASMVLYNLLRAKGYRARMVTGEYFNSLPDRGWDWWGHAWVECAGLILDPTRDQFHETEVALSAPLDHPNWRKDSKQDGPLNLTPSWDYCKVHLRGHAEDECFCPALLERIVLSAQALLTSFR